MKSGTIRKKIEAIENRVKKHANEKKYNIKPRLYIILISIVVIGIIISLFVIFSSLKKTTEIGENMDASLVNISKQADELKTEYEKEGNIEKFVNEYNEVQNKVGLYILDNSTLDNNSFDNIIKDIRKVLPKEDWSKLNIEKPIYWAGDWTIDNEGNIRFKFKDKKIEPNWITSEDITNDIIRN